MKSNRCILVLASVLALSCTAPGSSTAAPAAIKTQARPAYKVSGPFTSDNLAVYLIHGEEKLKGQTIQTLEEALRNKKVIVEETSNVNELRVRNLSNSVVFLQSGDILRGGKQDRAVQYDMLLPSKAGFTPVPVFCVEHGRWQGRGSEASESFAVSENQFAGREIKMAVKKTGDQSAVWQGVSRYQEKMSQKLGSNVCGAASPSSLELTMEHNKVKAATANHLRDLSNVPGGKTDVIGYAFSVNGKMSSADVYASGELFRKLWPKLLKSSAAEAVAERSPGAVPAPPATADVLKFVVEEPAKRKVVEKMKTSESYMSEQEDGKFVMYKTRWYNAPRRIQIIDGRPLVRDTEAPVVHSNIIAK